MASCHPALASGIYSRRGYRLHMLMVLTSTVTPPGKPMASIMQFWTTFRPLLPASIHCATVIRVSAISQTLRMVDLSFIRGGSP